MQLGFDLRVAHVCHGFGVKRPHCLAYVAVHHRPLDELPLLIRERPHVPLRLAPSCLPAASVRRPVGCPIVELWQFAIVDELLQTTLDGRICLVVPLVVLKTRWREEDGWEVEQQRRVPSEHQLPLAVVPLLLPNPSGQQVDRRRDFLPERPRELPSDGVRVGPVFAALCCAVHHVVEASLEAYRVLENPVQIFLRVFRFVPLLEI